MYAARRVESSLGGGITKVKVQCGDSYNIGRVQGRVDGKMWYEDIVRTRNKKEEEGWRRIHLEIVSASVWPLAYWN